MTRYLWLTVDLHCFEFPSLCVASHRILPLWGGLSKVLVELSLRRLCLRLLFESDGAPQACIYVTYVPARACIHHRVYCAYRQRLERKPKYHGGASTKKTTCPYLFVDWRAELQMRGAPRPLGMERGWYWCLDVGKSGEKALARAAYFCMHFSRWNVWERERVLSKVKRYYTYIGSSFH